MFEVLGEIERVRPVRDVAGITDCMDAPLRATLPLFGVGGLTLLLSILFCCCLWWLKRQGQREIGYCEIKYKKVKKSPNEVCAVCLDEFTPDEKIAMCKCKHSFHRKCLVQWLEHSNSCPLCKQAVRQDVGESTRLVV